MWSSFPPSLLSSQLINIWISVKYFVTQTLSLDYVLSCLQKANNLPGIASSTMCSLWCHLIFENNESVRVENNCYFLVFFIKGVNKLENRESNFTVQAFLLFFLEMGFLHISNKAKKNMSICMLNVYTKQQACPVYSKHIWYCGQEICPTSCLPHKSLLWFCKESK